MLLWTIFGPMPVWGTWGDLVVLGRTGRYELKAYRADGSLARIVRRGHTPRSPAQADVEARIDDQLGRSSDPSEDGRNRWHAAYQSVPVAEHFPAFAEVRSGRGGPPLGSGVRIPAGRALFAALDRVRPAGAGARVDRDARGPRRPSDRTGLHSGMDPGRAGRGVDSALVAGSERATLEGILGAAARSRAKPVPAARPRSARGRPKARPDATRTRKV